MADPKEFNNKEFQKDFKETVSVLKDTLVGLSASMGDAMSKAMAQSTDEVEKRAIKLVENDLAAAFKSVGKEVDKINDTNKTFIKGQNTVSQLQKKRAEQEAKFEKLDRARNEALKYGVELSEEQEKHYLSSQKAVEVFTKKQEDAAKELEGKLGGLVGLMDRITNIPIVGQLLNAGKASAAMKEELIESGNSMKAFGKGISAAFKGIEKSTIILAVISAAVNVFRFFKDLAFGVSEQITNIGRALGTSTETSRGLRENLYQIQRDTEGSYLNVKKLAASLIEVNQQFGYARGFSEDVLKTQTLLTNRVMSTGTEASYLNMIFKATGQNTEAAFENMNKLGIEMQLVDGIGVDIKTVISDIAEAGAETASYFGFSTTALTAAVIQARKLGLNISQAKNVAGGLLDFESSIQGQLELSVLTQKQFNFGQAMAKAATGDIVGATEIVLKQMNQLTAEQRKSPVILSAMSKATGLSTEELSKQYALQYDINEQKKEYGRILANEGVVAAKNYLVDKGIQLAEVEEITKRVSAGEKFTEALEAAKEAFASIVSGGLLDRLMLVLEKVVDFLERRFGISQSANVKALTQIQNTSTDKDRVAAAKALQPKMAAADKAASDLLRMQESTARIGPGAGMMSPKQIEMYDARMNEQRKLAAAVQSLADAEKKSNELLKEVAKNTGQKQDLKVDLDGSAVGSKLTRSKSKIRATSGY